MFERMKGLSHSSMVEGLRPLVGGDNGWDYGILWKLSRDQMYLEWMGCCCCGAEASNDNGGGLFSGGSSAQKSPCRDLIFQHPRTMACDALSGFSSSVPLDSCLGIYAQALMSNQCTWQTIHHAGSTSSHETVGTQTRVLVPIPGGLVELFVSKHVPEDQHTIDFVMSQCNAISYEQATADFLDESCDYTSKNNQWMSADSENFQWDPSLADQSQLYNSPLNLFDGSMGVQVQLDSTIDNATYQQSLMTTGRRLQQPGTIEENSVVVGQEKELVKQEAAGRGDSGSEGSEDDEEARPLGRNGKRHHSKNLMAERKRRKKLNDRLYALRALVPKITKMDRASILGDAIEHVMELQKQVKDLQNELETEIDFEDSDAKQNESNNEMDTTNPNGMTMSAAHGMELDESPNSPSARMAAVNAKPTNSIKQSSEQSNTEEKGNQMEPQVEVRQLEANEFYLKVFCEHKVGGFARLMEAMSTLGLEVTSVTVTTLQTLVLNVFRVQKRDNDMMQVDQVRDSLLELTRGPTGGWAEPGLAAANGGGVYQHDNRYRRGSHHLSSLHQLH